MHCMASILGCLIFDMEILQTNFCVIFHSTKYFSYVCRLHRNSASKKWHKPDDRLTGFWYVLAQHQFAIYWIWKLCIIQIKSITPHHLMITCLKIGALLQTAASTNHQTNMYSTYTYEHKLLKLIVLPVLVDLILVITTFILATSIFTYMKYKI